MYNVLTEKIISDILQNRFNNEETKLINFNSKLIFQNQEGYMGEHFLINVTFEKNREIATEDFFMKQKLTKNQIQEDMLKNIYEKEIFLYDYLFKEFKRLNYNTDFAATGYYCIPNEAIIMENLKNKGYDILPRNTNFDLDQIKSVLKALALFHGASFAYEKTKSKELNKNYKLTDDFAKCLEETFFVQYTNKKSTALSYWAGCKKTILALTELLPENQKYKDKFINLLENFKIGKIFVQQTKYPKTCGHGDLWSNNMMFKMDGKSLVKCCLVDFQVLRYFYPSFDVLLAIFSNTNKSFREKHLKELCTYYYQTLSDIYKNYGYDHEVSILRDLCNHVKIVI